MRDLYADNPLPYQHPRYERDGRGVEPGPLDLWYIQDVGAGDDKNRSQPYATEGEALGELMGGEKPRPPDRYQPQDIVDQVNERDDAARATRNQTSPEEMRENIAIMKGRIAEVKEAMADTDDKEQLKGLKRFLGVFESELETLIRDYNWTRPRGD